MDRRELFKNGAVAAAGLFAGSLGGKTVVAGEGVTQVRPFGRFQNADTVYESQPDCVFRGRKIF